MDKPIKALLLAAGLGTRLKPLTLNIPKCLVEINHKPVIEFWFEKFEKIKIQEVIINTHYLHQKVEKYIETQYFRKFLLKTIFEKRLLGTAATLIQNKRFFSNSLGLLIHADNFTNIDLENLINAHKNKPKDCILTMLTFSTKEPQKCGIVQLDNQGIMSAFYEKVTNPIGNIANGAVYLFEDEFLQWLTLNNPNAKDFSTEVIPKLVGKIFTYHTDSIYIDIGTLESLEEARKMAKFF